MDSAHLQDTSVLVAMSGGVDSSLCAWMLAEEGLRTAGLTMTLLPGSATGPEVEDARRVCEQIGIPHHVVDFEQAFEDQVIASFCNSYLNGETPNPCVECNHLIKFGLLHEKREELGANYLATGHYARCSLDEATGRWQLLTAKDANKDQTYFLWKLCQDALAHTLFPLGSMEKTEVRKLAEAADLPVAHKSESQDVCFIPNGDYLAVIEERLSREQEEECVETKLLEPGDIEDANGNVLGRHTGLASYTIGQRKGIGVSAEEPLYVIGKNVARNVLIVGHKEQNVCNGLHAKEMNLVSAPTLEKGAHLKAKVRYRQKPFGVRVEDVQGNGFSLSFDEPQDIPAAGQSVVLYDRDMVVAGGVISDTL